MKYNVGDKIVLMDNKTYEIVRINPSRPVNKYSIVGNNGKSYCCGDRSIVGLAGKVSEEEIIEVKKNNIYSKYNQDVQSVKNSCEFMSICYDIPNAELWIALSKMAVGDKITLASGKTGRFIGVAFRRKKFPIGVEIERKVLKCSIRAICFNES